MIYKNRILAVGDIHGNFKALKQVLERSGFDYDNDTLITLGDIADGYNEVYECIEELLKIKNRIDIAGNHDNWFLEYALTGVHPVEFKMGGGGTRDSYLRSIGKEGMYIDSLWGSMSALNPGDIPDSHKDFFRHQVSHYIHNGYICFVHGGFDREYPIEIQHPMTLCWDRNLWEKAMSCTGKQKLTTANNFSHIFIGHTACNDHKNKECLPITRGGVTNLDTGAGWSGKLTIMDIDTMEYWQSDISTKLYPGYTSR